MWIDFLSLLAEIGLIKADYDTAKQVEKANAKNEKQGLKKKYVILPSAKLILIALSVVLILSIVRIWIVFPHARKSQAYTEMKEIKKGLDSYKAEIGLYPFDLNELIGNRPLRKSWKQDKWQTEYIYEQDSIKGTFILISAGKDCKLNTEDDLIIKND